ncbi:MAG: response regulator [Deltaproteobacteria bacterium]|nr:response regulator [Candidatus Tharpella sp.]
MTNSESSKKSAMVSDSAVSVNHKTRQELQKSEQRLQLALDGSGLGLWEWNVKTGEIHFGPRFTEPCTWCHISQDDPVKHHISEIVNPKNNLSYNVSHTPITNLDGSVSTMTICRDVTKMKNLEAQLYQSRKMEAMGTLAGGIAHDFNNILTAILGFSELAKLNIDETNGESIKMIDQVIISSQRAVELVRQILSFSRNEPQKICLIKPHLIVSEALKLLHSSLPATVKIEEDIDRKCGQIKADPIQLHQVVMNICTNALHSLTGQKGTLKVKLYQRLITADEVVGNSHRYSGEFVILSISDTGCGIDSATKARIFEPYFTTKNVGEGTGLGLAVVHGIVESYNGFIEVESEIGQGTTFKIYLPVFSDSSSKIELGKHADGKLATGTEHILIVDDEKPILDLQAAILARLGYKITAINQSSEALTRFTSDPEKFDLIITDQSMPDLSGAELAVEILKIRPTMPVILCTGYSAVVNKEDALTIGIKKYLEKPVSIRELVQIVRLVLDESLKRGQTS